MLFKVEVQVENTTPIISCIMPWGVLSSRLCIGPGTVLLCPLVGIGIDAGTVTIESTGRSEVCSPSGVRRSLPRQMRLYSNPMGCVEGCPVCPDCRLDGRPSADHVALLRIEWGTVLLARQVNRHPGPDDSSGW